jgi:hypothetical protein
VSKLASGEISSQCCRECAALHRVLLHAAQHKHPYSSDIPTSCAAPLVQHACTLASRTTPPIDMAADKPHSSPPAEEQDHHKHRRHHWLLAGDHATMLENNPLSPSSPASMHAAHASKTLPRSTPGNITGACQPVSSPAALHTAFRSFMEPAAHRLCCRAATRASTFSRNVLACRRGSQIMEQASAW